MAYTSIIQEFPPELQFTMLKFAEAIEQNLREQLAVRRTDFDGMRAEMRELTAAQQRSEQRLERLETVVNELAEAQKRTEQRVNELAEAQQQTQQELRQLVAVVRSLAEEGRDTRRQLGGLTMTVGYQLENEAYKALPGLLARDFNLAVQERLKRGYVNDKDGKPLEINILGQARHNGEEVMIVGESKAQLSKNDVDRFLRRKVQRLTGVYQRLFPLLITHMTSEPDVESYARAHNVALYYSYDF
jgi:hypothetical protein